MNEHASSGESAVDAGFVTVSVASLQVARPTSWVRAMVVGVGVSLALAVLLLWCPHWMLTRLPMLARGIRVAMATVWIVLVTVGMIWFAARVAPQSPVEP